MKIADYFRHLNIIKDTQIMKYLHKSFLTVLFLIAAQSAFALSIGEIKSQRLAGEQANGYVGIISENASTEIKNMVNEVNSKRRTIYQKLATQQKISLAEVEKLAGARNIGKTPSGQLIRESSGSWITKK